MEILLAKSPGEILASDWGRCMAVVALADVEPSRATAAMRIADLGM